MKTKTLWIVGLLSVGLLLTAQSFADTCGDKKDKDNKAAFMTATQALSTCSTDNNADCDKKKMTPPRVMEKRTKQTSRH
jgi:hypothetical protein